MRFLLITVLTVCMVAPAYVPAAAAASDCVSCGQACCCPELCARKPPQRAPEAYCSSGWANGGHDRARAGKTASCAIGAASEAGAFFFLEKRGESGGTPRLSFSALAPLGDEGVGVAGEADAPQPFAPPRTVLLPPPRASYLL